MSPKVDATELSCFFFFFSPSGHQARVRIRNTEVTPTALLMKILLVSEIMSAFVFLILDTMQQREIR